MPVKSKSRFPSRRKSSAREKREKTEIKELKLLLAQEEINSLEQRIKEDVNNVDFSEIKGFLKETDSSPSLQKINAPQKSPIILERDVITGNMSIKNTNGPEENNSGELKYLPTPGKEEEKYIPQYGQRIAEVVQKTEFEKNSQKNIFERREIKMGNSFKETMPEMESFEKYSSPKGKIDRFDPLQKTKKNIFEKKEVKYTPGGY